MRFKLYVVDRVTGKPLARALTGRAVGEQVDIEIDGHRETWVIKGIGRWVDEQS